MIETRVNTIGGLTAPVLVYSSVEEADKVLAGGILEQGNFSLIYRQVLPTVREVICNLVETETGVVRTSKVTGKTKGGKDILTWEPDGKYIERALAEKGLSDFSSLQAKLDELVRNYKESDDAVPAPLAVDLTEKVRKAPAVKKLAEKFLVAASKILAMGTVDKANTKLLKKINLVFTPTHDTTELYAGNYTNGESTVPFSVSKKDATSLGEMLKTYTEWKAAQDLAL